MFRSALVSLAIVIAVPAVAFAQTVPAPPPAVNAPTATTPGAPAASAHRHGGRYMRALRTVGLSADQKAQIRGFVRDTRTANQGADKPTKRANMQKLRSEIDGVLTPDQRAQLRQSMAVPPAAPPAQ